MSQGVDVGEHEHAAAILKAVGYYRLTGYLYPFRLSDHYVDNDGRVRIRVLSGYKAGTRLDHAEAVIDFDRQLRMIVMDVRMQVGYVLGRISAFAHEDPSCYTEAFVAAGTDPDSGEPVSSPHAVWLERVSVARTRGRAAGQVRRAVRRALPGSVRRPDAGLGAYRVARARPALRPLQRSA